MGDIFTKEKRSAVMSAIRSRGNRETELRLVTLLRSNHIKGWRRHGAIFGSPDFVFQRERVVIFVDGDFWHGHPTRSRLPVSRREFWLKKITANRMRDRLVNRTLRSEGWLVLRIWEFSLKRRFRSRTLGRIRRALAAGAILVRDNASRTSARP
jgi:DNA mismatch endonuclease (patch repair protein)